MKHIILLIAFLTVPARGEDVLSTLAGTVILAGSRGQTISSENEFKKLVCEIKVGGVILFDKDQPSRSRRRNIRSTRQLKRLTRNLQKLARRCATGPLLIAADVEGGRVNRLGRTLGFRSKSHDRLGRLDDADKTYAEARRIGKRLKKLGINWNLAPVVDVNLYPRNPIIGELQRSFSNDPEKVALHADAFTRGLRDYGILNCLKHFPGLGTAREDPHLKPVDVTETADLDTELSPYRELIDNGMADAIMTAHLLNANLDKRRIATISPIIINGLLREELGFTGLVVSDDLQMAGIVAASVPKAAVLALRAGVDMIIVSNNIGYYDPDAAEAVRDALVRAVEDGKLDMSRLEEAAGRVRALKERLSQQR